MVPSADVSSYSSAYSPSSAGLPSFALPPELVALPPEPLLRRVVLSQLERDELDQTHFLTVRSAQDPARCFYVPLAGPFTWLFERGQRVCLLDIQPEGTFEPIDAVIALKLAILADEDLILEQAESYSFRTASPAILRALETIVEAPPVPAQGVPSSR